MNNLSDFLNQQQMKKIDEIISNWYDTGENGIRTQEEIENYLEELPYFIRENKDLSSEVFVENFREFLESL